MRKIYIALLSFITFALTTKTFAQQVNTYLFTQSTGTYTAITGGTVLGVPTGNGTTALDDANFAIATGSFPFTFTFAGTGYTGCTVNTNGFITFGTTTPGTAEYTPISGTGGYAGAIVAWAADINSVFNIAGQTGELRWETVGTAPNREVVIQWSKFRPSYTGSTTSAYVFDYQIRLAEGSNRVRIVYGGTLGYLVGSASYSGGIQIGLRGATNADYNSRTNPASAAFTASTASTANNNTQAYNTTVATPGMPTAGLTYTWLVPPPCVSGSLNGGTVQSSTLSACAATGFLLSVTGASFGTGLTYQWESSPDGAAWTPINTATNATYTATQTTATYYRRKMTCTGVDAYSTSVQVAQNGFLNCYCNTGLTTNINGIDIVTNVLVTNAAGTTLVQASASNGLTNYEQYNNTPIDLAQSTSSSVAITFGTDGTQYSSAWIDYNQNGVFEASENIGIATTSAGGSTTVTYNFAVPPTALLGNTRMRIRGGSDSQYSTGGACTNSTYGETEDYIVNIVAAPPCVAPTGLTVSALTTTTGTISWTASSPAPAAGYAWEVRTSGAGGSGAAGLVTSGTTAAGVVTANVAGLTANTAYTFYVRGVCSAGTLFSTWAASTVFVTPCNAISAFPFTETFETASVSRPCWSTTTTGSVNWTYGAGAGNGGNITTAHGGAINARFFGSRSLSFGKLISPRLDFSGLNPALGAQMTFWYANQNWAGDQNELRVFYKTSAGGTWTLVPGAVYTTNVGTWTEVTLTLPSSTGNDYYVAFEGWENFGWGVAVDDVTIEAVPTCPKPTAVSVLPISGTTAMVSFTSPGGAFVVEYGPVGFVPGTGNTAGGGTVQLGAASPITINGLTAGTVYDVYVRRICTPGVDYSTNVKSNFTTLCPATNIPYVQNFETATPLVGFPTCTSMEDVNGNSGPDALVTGGRWVTVTGTNVTSVSPTKSAKYLYDAANSTRAADDWVYMQAINMTAGTSYRLKFFYKGSDGPTWTENLEVKYGLQAYHTAMTNPVWSNSNIITNINTPFDSAIVDFTPAVSGAYYMGFHAISAADQAFIYLDDVSVKATPLVDVGDSSAVVPTCPNTAGVMQAFIKNYNITPQNFATYPITVTATITGTATTTLTTTVNTGTLAPGASLPVSLPAFNYVPGPYNVTITTSSVSDPEPGNDSYTTSFFVNPAPVAAIITPAAPAVCLGSSVQLSTQFVTPPPAPVTLPAVTSGAITVNVPDADATGAIHTLAVSGVPITSTVTGISVTINMTHTWIADMQFNLVAPNGKVFNLFNRHGGIAEANLTNTVISSTATTPFTATGAPFTGTWIPDGAAGVGPTGYVSNTTTLSDLYTIGNGNWTLAMKDNAGGDFGILTSWSITITYGTVYPAVTWTPTTGLFTNAGATTAYTGGNAYSIYAKPDATTTYTATSTNPATGCTSTSTVQVKVNALPSINIAPFAGKICTSDEQVSLSATPAGGTWTGIGVSGSNFIPVNTTVGTFNLTYTYTDALGCTNSKSTAAVVEDCPERIILLRDNAVILYPNPNNGQFNIRINSVLYNKLTMRVYTAAGALVHTQSLSGLAFGRVVPFNLNFLPAGSYMVQFSYIGGNRTSEKAFKVLIGH